MYLKHLYLLYSRKCLHKLITHPSTLTSQNSGKDVLSLEEILAEGKTHLRYLAALESISINDLPSINDLLSINDLPSVNGLLTFKLPIMYKRPPKFK